MLLFFPAQYCSNRILGGAQRRFWKDDACQTEGVPAFSFSKRGVPSGGWK